MNSISRAMLNRQLYRDTAKATMLDRNSTITTDGITIANVTIQWRPMFPRSYASRKLSSVSVFGHEKKPSVAVSANGRNADTTMPTRGIIQITTMAIRKTCVSVRFRSVVNI